MLLRIVSQVVVRGLREPLRTRLFLELDVMSMVLVGTVPVGADRPA